jgi:hypothetical protein
MDRNVRSSAVSYFYYNVGREGIQGVFHELFDNRRGTFHHFPGCNLIDNSVW